MHLFFTACVGSSENQREVWCPNQFDLKFGAVNQEFVSSFATGVAGGERGAPVGRSAALAEGPWHSHGSFCGSALLDRGMVHT